MKKIVKIIWICNISLLLLLSVLIVNVYAVDFEMDLDAIAQIESSNNPKAYNKITKAYGLYQIKEAALIDVNRKLICTDYSLQDMFIPCKGYVVAYSYLNALIPHYLTNYGIPDTVETRILAYCWGIGNVVKWARGELSIPKEALDYIMDYDRITEGVNNEK